MILLKNYINLRDNTESVLRHLLIIQLEQYIWLHVYIHVHVLYSRLFLRHKTINLEILRT